MKEKINKNSLITALILIIIGILGIAFVKNNIAENISCSILASGIVILATTIIVERVRIKPVDAWGLCNVYTTRKQMNEDCDKENGKARKNIDAIAFGLKSFREEYDIESVLKKGVNFRIITMDPDGAFVKQREKEEGRQSGYIKENILDLVKWADRHNEKNYKGKIEIKGYSCMTLDFYWRVDDTLFVGPYWYDTDSQKTVSYCYKKGNGFDIYTAYFEKLWNDNKLMKKLSN